ncbi:MAG: ribonuclease HII [Paludibacteraceae bacterium]|nr:ribonuclease HII [Paludibacteraceae bacterium]
MLRTCYLPNLLEAGCDEAGRGPLAGSVFAAAVILPPSDNPFWQQQDNWFTLLNDSKQLSESLRYQLRPLIERDAVAWAVAEVTPQEIDHINILNAALLAMRRALQQLTVQPQHILVDGNRWKGYYLPSDNGMDGVEVPAQTVVKGDATFMSIAAASVLAKTYRDDYMKRLSAEYPQYGWDTNMGYPTAQHYAAIEQFGITPYHRKSFKLFKF